MAGSYDYSCFGNKVLDFEVGFVDLGTPTIDQLFRLCYSFHYWLKLHPQNVVVCHGKDDPVAVGVAVGARAAVVAEYNVRAVVVAEYSVKREIFSNTKKL